MRNAHNSEHVNMTMQLAYLFDVEIEEVYTRVTLQLPSHSKIRPRTLSMAGVVVECLQSFFLAETTWLNRCPSASSPEDGSDSVWPSQPPRLLHIYLLSASFGMLLMSM